MSAHTSEEPISTQQIEDAILLLKQLSENVDLFASLPDSHRIELLKWAGVFSKQDKEDQQKRKKALKTAR